jgi:hypothetical protein
MVAKAQLVNPIVTQQAEKIVAAFLTRYQLVSTLQNPIRRLIRSTLAIQRAFKKRKQRSEVRAKFLLAYWQSKIHQKISDLLKSKKSKKDDIEILKMLGNEYFGNKSVHDYYAMRSLDFEHKFNLQKWFSVSNVLLALVVWLAFSFNRDYFNIASWLVLPFLTMAFGLSKHTLLSRLTPTDYSYGIYIYAFPVQQAVVSVWPNMPLAQYLGWVTVGTLALAAASWHCVEKPALAFKPRQNRV